MHRLTIVLYEPEIPPNTGNIIRLCANTGAHLCLIEPLGFPLDDKRMRRAGLDYHEFANMEVLPNWAAFCEVYAGRRILALSTHGKKYHHEIAYQAGDVLLFGPETRGLPPSVRESLPADQLLRIPMQQSSRSLNLSNAVAVVLYEALRQQGFEGLV